MFLGTRTAFVSLALAASALAAPPEHLGGHSLRGAAFDEGPRQSAVLLGGTGAVTFPLSTRNDEARKFFLQGLGQLHGFASFEAERSFRQMAKLDDGSPMAYWGMAMANIVFDAGDFKRGRAFAAEAKRREANGTDQERMHVAALDTFFRGDAPERTPEAAKRLIEALDAIVKKYPEDLEARAFLALFTWDFLGEVDARALDNLREVLRVNPRHPGAHHYWVHTHDSRAEAAKALESCALEGPSAPGIAHQWHMPGHIYSKLDRIHDMAWHQEASSRVDHKTLTERRVMPYEIHNYLHNQEWLLKTLQQLGRGKDALALAENLHTIPTFKKKNTSGPKTAQREIPEIVARFERWDLVQKVLAGSLAEPYGERVVLLKHRLRALAAVHAKAWAKVDDIITVLEKVTGDERDTAGYMLTELKSLRDLHSKDTQARQKAKQRLGDFYAPLLMHAAVPLVEGDAADVAEKIFRKLHENGPQEALPLANLVWILYSRGKEDEARTKFAALRTVAGQADLELKPFARLAPLAKEFGYPADWRTPPVTSPEVAALRPPLAMMGSFLWEPFSAPTLSLTDEHDKPVTLVPDKPRLLVHYLGGRCLACARQLRTLLEYAPKFADAGIEIAAVSPDPPEDLVALRKVAEQAGFPFTFPLYSDASKATFQALGAYDDFEDFPLHGVFLVDGEGKIRWQYQSAAPFTDFGFLLTEAKRLLKK